MTETLGGTLNVSHGGTGDTSFTPYSVILGGTTSTGALQNVSGVGTSGEVLTSNGASADPTWQAIPSSSISITGDTGGPLTGDAFTFTGGTSGLTFAGSGTTETLGGTLNVSHGGTGDTSFTPYSLVTGGTTSTSPLQNVSGVGTSGQLLTSNGASALPTWQTAATSSISITGDSGGALTGDAFTFTGGTTGLTFSGSGTTETVIGTLNVAHGGTSSNSFNINGAVYSNTTTTGALQAATLTSGQLLIGGTTTPAAATLTAGNGISITNGNNSITIASTEFFTWHDESGAFNALAFNGYFIAGTCTGTLPASPNNGDTIRFFVDGAFTLTIQANTGQTIKIATNVSSSAGTQSNTASGDACTLVYRSTDTQWNCINYVGAWNKT
jgi:hypothetical protein